MILRVARTPGCDNECKSCKIFIRSDFGKYGRTSPVDTSHTIYSFVSATSNCSNFKDVTAVCNVCNSGSFICASPNTFMSMFGKFLTVSLPTYALDNASATTFCFPDTCRIYEGNSEIYDYFRVCRAVTMFTYTSIHTFIKYTTVRIIFPVFRSFIFCILSWLKNSSAHGAKV